jgi:hypothetical protein
MFLLAGALASPAAAAGLPAYQPTGDALYDGVARFALTDAQYRDTESPLVGGVALAVVTGEAAAVARFAGDQHYQEALLLLTPEADRRAAADKLLVQGRTTPGLFVAAPPALWYLDDEQRALGLCDQAIGLDPDNSYFYYEKAVEEISLGEWDAARAAAEAGNAAPRNAAVWPYPLERVMAGEAGSGPANDAAAGYFYLAVDDVGRWGRVKEAYREILVALSLGTPPGQMDVFLTMAQRMAQMSGQSLTGVQYAKVCAEMLLRAVGGVEFPGFSGETPAALMTLSPAQQQELDSMRMALGGIDPLVAAAFPASGEEAPGLAGLPGMWAYGSYASVVDLNSPGYGVDDLAQLGAALRRAGTVVARAQAQFDCLSPPPLAAWEQGRPAR